MYHDVPKTSFDYLNMIWKPKYAPFDHLIIWSCAYDAKNVQFHFVDQCFASFKHVLMPKHAHFDLWNVLFMMSQNAQINFSKCLIGSFKRVFDAPACSLWSCKCAHVCSYSASGQNSGCNSLRPCRRNTVMSKEFTSEYGGAPRVISSQSKTPNDHCVKIKFTEMSCKHLSKQNSNTISWWRPTKKDKGRKAVVNPYKGTVKAVFGNCWEINFLRSVHVCSHPLDLNRR